MVGGLVFLGATAIIVLSFGPAGGHAFLWLSGHGFDGQHGPQVYRVVR